jgi:hypothetical protein
MNDLGVRFIASISLQMDASLSAMGTRDSMRGFELLGGSLGAMIGSWNAGMGSSNHRVISPHLYCERPATG